MELNKKELFEKVKGAKSAEELIALAKENGLELTEEQANEFFAKLSMAEALSDDVLDDVVGGLRPPVKDERSRNGDKIIY